MREVPAANPGEAEAEQSTEGGPNARTDIDGKRVLFDSANATMVTRSITITKKLEEKAGAGDSRSVKLLVEMMKLGKQDGSRASKWLREFIGTLESDSELMNSDPSGNQEA